MSRKTKSAFMGFMVLCLCSRVQAQDICPSGETRDALAIQVLMASLMSRAQSCNADLGFKAFAQITASQAGQTLRATDDWFRNRGGEQARRALLRPYVSDATNAPECDSLTQDLRKASVNLIHEARSSVAWKRLCTSAGTAPQGISTHVRSTQGPRAVQTESLPTPGQAMRDNAMPDEKARQPRPGKAGITSQGMQVIEYDPLPNVAAEDTTTEQPSAVAASELRPSEESTTHTQKPMSVDEVLAREHEKDNAILKATQGFQGEQ